MRDYLDLKDAIPGVVEFEALDSRYPAFDPTGQRLKNESGDYLQQPYAPAVWSHLVEAYLDRARQAFTQGETGAAHEYVSRCAVLLAWRYDREDEPVDVLHAEVPRMPRLEIAAAVEARHNVSDGVVAAWLLGAFQEVGTGVGRYPLLDDPSWLLSDEVLSQTSAVLDRHSKIRGVEAGLAAAVLRTLPSPDVRADWSELASIRQDLRLPLRRFRAAMAELSQDVSADQLTRDFDDAADQILRTKVWPVLYELEELVREGALRHIFFRDVTGDLSTYAGPLVGLATATTGALPELLSAAVAAVTPAVSSLSHVAQNRRAVRAHEFFFVREAERRHRRG